MIRDPRHAYLRKRGETWWLRLAVPGALRPLLDGKRHIEETLGTKDLRRANEVKHGRIDHWRKEFERLEREASTLHGGPQIPPHLRHAEEVRVVLRDLPDESDDEGYDPNREGLEGYVTDIAEGLERKEPGQGVAFARHAFRGETLRDAFERFLRDGEHTAGTQANYRQTFDEFMGHLGDPLAAPSDVTRAVAERYVDWLNHKAVSSHKGPLAARTKTERVRRLASLWKGLEARQIVPHGANPWRGHTITGKRKIEKHGTEGMRREHSDAEILQIIEGVNVRSELYNKERVRDLYALGFYTALRLDELCSRKVADIEPLEGRRKGYTIHVRKAKTKAGVRSIPVVHPVPVAILGRLLGDRKEGLLFPYLTGGGPDNKLSKNAENALSRYRKRLKLPKGVVFHSTRNNFQTRAYELGINRDWIEAYVGHQLIGLPGTYVGKMPDALRKVAEAIRYSETVEKAWRTALGLREGTAKGADQAAN